MTSRIDVIIPCRNAPNVLSLMLTHFWAYAMPTGLVRSVVVLDNASTDPAMPALLAYVASRPLHTVIRHEENVGVWCSTNRGLAATTASLVLILHADMLIGPGLLETLVAAYDQSKCAMIGPDNGCWGLARHAEILPTGGPMTMAPDYHGGCWLLDWPRCRDTVGWYDSRFYICAGDVDYVERLWTQARASGDPTWNPHCIRGLNVCHLDKQSRRAEATAHGDATMELNDLGRLHAKWRETRPDICARHPMPTMAGQLAYKAAHDGGWEQGKVGA